MYELKCTICGNTYTSRRKDGKYCSGCRTTAHNQCVSRQWYKHKEERITIEREFLETLISEEQAQNEENRIANNKAIRERAENGDLQAQLSVAMRDFGKYSYEYWNAFKNLVISSSEKKGLIPTRTVNGISVLEPEFAFLVMDAIKEQGCCFSEV